MALRLAEVEPRDYEFICNATGNELPEMREHWIKLQLLLGVEIKPVRHTQDLVNTCRSERMLPNVFRRWCTRILKIEPTIKYFEELPDDSTLYVGLRADEEIRRGLYGEDIKVDFPLRRWGWSECDVLSYLESRQITVPERTDCGLCPYQRLGEWRNLYFQNRSVYDEGVALEDEFGKTIRSPGRDTWPADLRTLAKDFESGRPLREYKRATTCRLCSL